MINVFVYNIWASGRESRKKTQNYINASVLSVL